MKVKYFEEGKFPPLKFDVWDYDFTSTDDFLGSVTISLDKCKENPNSWAINHTSDLKIKKTPDKPAG